MASVNSRFASVTEAEILKIQEDAAPEPDTKKATKFGMKVFRGKKILNILQTVSRIRACFVPLARFLLMN